MQVWLIVTLFYFFRFKFQFNLVIADNPLLLTVFYSVLPWSCSVMPEVQEINFLILTFCEKIGAVFHTRLMQVFATFWQPLISRCQSNILVYWTWHSIYCLGSYLALTYIINKYKQCLKQFLDTVLYQLNCNWIYLKCSFIIILSQNVLSSKCYKVQSNNSSVHYIGHDKIEMYLISQKKLYTVAKVTQTNFTQLMTFHFN